MYQQRLKDNCVATLMGYISKVEMKQIKSNNGQPDRKVLNILVGSQQARKNDESNIIFRRVEIWDNPDSYSWVRPGMDIIVMCYMHKDIVEFEDDSGKVVDKKEYENFRAVMGGITIRSYNRSKSSSSKNYNSDEENSEEVS